MTGRRNSPGFGEWLIVAFTVGVLIFLLFKLYEFAQVRQNFPTGLTVAGVDIGGLAEEDARNRLSQFYLNTPITLLHGDQPIEINPSRAEFQLDLDKLMVDAIAERDNQPFWWGYWGYLWNRPVAVRAISLDANPESVGFNVSHNEEALRRALGLVANQFDQVAEQAQSSGSEMDFLPGATGTVTDIEASLPDVTNALYRPYERQARLVLNSTTPDAPTIAMLNNLLTNRMQEFESQTGSGIGSVFVIDLTTRNEVGYNVRVPMKGTSVLRLPVMTVAMALFSETLNQEQLLFLRTTATTDPTDHISTNELLRLISGDVDDAFVGADMVTGFMQAIGLENSFIGCPFGLEEDERADCKTYETESNQRYNEIYSLDPHHQTTAEDMGLLLLMLYECGQNNGGTLRAIYSSQITATKCQQIVGFLHENDIGTLIEEGVPREQVVVHRHGWDGDTYGDAGIVYSPNGHYVIVEYAHQPDFLAWEVSSVLMRDLSLAAYNYFNFDDPFAGQ